MASAKHKFVPRETGWYAARTAAGHPTLHFHDLRATGATLLAQQGATEAEIQAFLGDSTPQAAQRYVRAAQSRMKAHAERMSVLATSGNW
jgi:integrase